jgi:hypothetical protein
MGIDWTGLSTRRSWSPVMRASALAALAVARILVSAGSRRLGIEFVAGGFDFLAYFLEGRLSGVGFQSLEVLEKLI